jgi:hypothetical protein
MYCHIKTIEGTFIRFVVTLEIPGNITMDDVDFSIDFYVFPNKKRHFKKAETFRIDENSCAVTLDTSGMGAGRILYTIDVVLPDGSREIIGSRTDETLQAHI